MRVSALIPQIKGTLATFIVVLGVLSGCSGSGQEREAAASQGEAQTPISSSQSTEPAGAEQDQEILPGYAKLREEQTDDLDEMAERGYIRALVVHGKTTYFLDGAQQRGLTYEAMREFERFLNKKLGRRRQKVHIVFIPVSRDELIPSVANGTGDIAAANLTVTPEREKLVDFSDAGIRNVKELVVTTMPLGASLRMAFRRRRSMSTMLCRLALRIATAAWAAKRRRRTSSSGVNSFPPAFSVR